MASDPTTGYPNFVSGAINEALMGVSNEGAWNQVTTADADFPVFNFGDTNNMNAILRGMLDGVPVIRGNPYLMTTAYDPDEAISNISDRLDLYTDFIDSVEEVSLWGDYVDAVVDRLPDIVPGLDDLDDELTAQFERGTMIDLARQYNRIAAPLNDVNAICGTVYPMCAALIEIENERVIAAFRAEKQFNIEKQKVAAALGLMESLVSLFTLRGQMMQSSFGATQDFNRLSVGLETDQINEELHRDVDGAQWNMNVLKSGMEVLGAIKGLPTSPKAPSTVEKVVSGAASGIGFGVNIGVAAKSMPIGIGMAIAGSLGGAALGLFG